MKRSQFSIISLIILLLGTPISASALAKSIPLQAEIFSAAPFMENVGPNKFGSYLTKNLPFGPIKALKKFLEKSTGLTLIDRGEAHITVINPTEFEIMKSVMSISDINDMASAQVQRASFKIVCLGRGDAMIDGKNEVAYFIVVKSPILLAIRNQIAEKFIELGGDSADFDPDNFFPHITVGFTKRDLHPQDNVFKDQSSCVADLVSKPVSKSLPAPSAAQCESKENYYCMPKPCKIFSKRSPPQGRPRI